MSTSGSTSPLSESASGSNSTSSSDLPLPDLDSPKTLEEAVEAYTDLALRDLAQVLGLDLDRLEEELRRHEMYTARKGHSLQRQRKRSQRSQTAAHDTKRQRTSSPLGQRRPSPLPPRPADPELVAIALRDKWSSSSPTDKSVHTHLGWAANSEDLEAHRTALKKGTGKPETQLERLTRKLVTPEPKSSQAASRREDARHKRPQGSSQGSDSQDKQTPK
ncbi:MAG: hypothetical protein Q9181_006889 [Wetmoreana brouardii]